MIITVTKTDIKKGKKESTTCCPIALAVKRKLKKPQLIYVFRDEIRFGRQWGNNYDNDIDLPKSAVKFIDKFDDGEKVKPFSFTLSAKELKRILA